LDIYISSANLRKSDIGSEPADNTNIRGVIIVASLKHLANSNVGAIINSYPSYSAIQFYIAKNLISNKKYLE
jgi:hypothetical protein